MKPVTDSESSSETSETYHDGPAVVDHENVYAQNITCDAAFKFYKVGKASHLNLRQLSVSRKIFF